MNGETQIKMTSLRLPTNMPKLPPFPNMNINGKRSRDSIICNETPDIKRRKLDEKPQPLPLHPNFLSFPLSQSSASSSSSFSSSISRTSPSAISSDSTQSSNNSVHSNIAKQLNGISKTLGLKIPNIAIQPMTPNNALSGFESATNTDRINNFLFGQQHQMHKLHPSQHQQPIPQQLPFSLSNIGASTYDIDRELAKEVNKREMRQIISCQLDQIKQQMMRQEQEDEARVKALKFMKMIQTTQSHNIQRAINPLPINPALSCSAKPPLPLPQMLKIPPLKQSKPIKPSLSASSPFGYDQNINKQQLRMPKMSDGKEWNAVSKDVKKDYKGYGRETVIAASKQIQSRSQMSQSQIEIVCNCMIELSFTEKLNCTKENDEKNQMKNEKKMIIDSEKISSLNMNLNTTSKKMNGFSPLFRNQNDFNIQSAFNIALPTFKQTSNSSSMPRLEIDSSHQSNNQFASSSSESSSDSSSSDGSENEIIQKKIEPPKKEENEK